MYKRFLFYQHDQYAWKKITLFLQENTLLLYIDTKSNAFWGQIYEEINLRPDNETVIHSIVKHFFNLNIFQNGCCKDEF